MEQRRLRLGDILDDYCPRERRITNHAVVALVDEDVKQTRCTTCDADHEYKHGKMPAPRRRKTAGALAAEGAEGADARPVLAAAVPAPVDDDTVSEDDSLDHDDTPVADENLQAAADSEPEPEEVPVASAGADDDGPVHRRLIRATLPRPEGHVPERKEPDFTLRQQGGRGYDQGRNGHRAGGHRSPRQAQGGQGGPSSRFGGGQRQGGQGGGQGSSHGQRQGQGQGQGNRPSRPGGPHRGPRPAGQGRKRGR